MRSLSRRPVLRGIATAFRLRCRRTLFSRLEPILKVIQEIGVANYEDPRRNQACIPPCPDCPRGKWPSHILAAARNQANTSGKAHAPFTTSHQTHFLFHGELRRRQTCVPCAINNDSRQEPQQIWRGGGFFSPSIANALSLWLLMVGWYVSMQRSRSRKVSPLDLGRCQSGAWHSRRDDGQVFNNEAFAVYMPRSRTSSKVSVLYIPPPQRVLRTRNQPSCG